MYQKYYDIEEAALEWKCKLRRKGEWNSTQMQERAFPGVGPILHKEIQRKLKLRGNRHQDKELAVEQL